MGNVYIYAITNNLNFKTYIGQTNNPKYRFKCHIKNKKNSLIHKAINKYNKENFTFTIIEELQSREEANESEIFYIQLFGTLSPNGYNLSKGGKCSSPTTETKEKIRKSLKENPSLNVKLKGSNHPRFGHKHSPEIRDKINKQISGDNCTSSKIKKEDAIYIYSLAYMGLSVNQIKLLFNLKSSAIHNIINRKCWKDELKDLLPITNKPNGHKGKKERLELLSKIISKEIEVLPPIKQHCT